MRIWMRWGERWGHLNLILKSATGDPLGFIVLSDLSDGGPGNDYPTFTTSEHQTGSLEWSAKTKIYPSLSRNQEKEKDWCSRVVAGTLFDLSVCPAGWEVAGAGRPIRHWFSRLAGQTRPATHNSIEIISFHHQMVWGDIIIQPGGRGIILLGSLYYSTLLQGSWTSLACAEMCRACSGRRRRRGGTEPSSPPTSWRSWRRHLR